MEKCSCATVGNDPIWHDIYHCVFCGCHSDAAKLPRRYTQTTAKRANAINFCSASFQCMGTLPYSPIASLTMV